MCFFSDVFVVRELWRAALTDRWVGVPSCWLTFPMLVDTANARRASTARMPGSQVVRKTEGAESTRGRTAFFCVCTSFCVSTLMSTAFMFLLFSCSVQTGRLSTAQAANCDKHLRWRVESPKKKNNSPHLHQVTSEFVSFKNAVTSFCFQSERKDFCSWLSLKQ